MQTITPYNSFIAFALHLSNQPFIWNLLALFADFTCMEKVSYDKMWNVLLCAVAKSPEENSARLFENLWKHFLVNISACLDRIVEGGSKQKFCVRSISYKIFADWFTCSSPLWRLVTAIKICASFNHRKKVKAEPSGRLLPRMLTRNLELLII